MKRRRVQQVISDDELIERYAFLLGNVPASVADRAYAAAFAQLSPEQREDVIEQLRAELPAAPQDAASHDPDAFARLMRDLHARYALVSIRDAATIAAAFIASPPIVNYFTAGAGSVSIDQQPPWVHDLAGHVTAPIDGGRAHHRPGVNSGEWFGT